MERSDGRTGRGGSAAESRLRSHTALIAIVRLLARQAARDALLASRVEQEMQEHDDED